MFILNEIFIWSNEQMACDMCLTAGVCVCKWVWVLAPLQRYINEITLFPQIISNAPVALLFPPLLLTDKCTFPSSTPIFLIYLFPLCLILMNFLFFWFKLLYFHCSFSSAFSHTASVPLHCPQSPFLSSPPNPLSTFYLTLLKCESHILLKRGTVEEKGMQFGYWI